MLEHCPELLFPPLFTKLLTMIDCGTAGTVRTVDVEDIIDDSGPRDRSMTSSILSQCSCSLSSPLLSLSFY